MKQKHFSRMFFAFCMFVLVACQHQTTQLVANNSTSTPTRYQAEMAVVTMVAPTETPVPMPAAINVDTLAEWKIIRPADIVFGFDSVWIPSHRSPNVTTRIDPTINKVIAVVENTGYFAHSALVTNDSIWIDGEMQDMSRINPKTNTIINTVSGSHTSLVYGFGSIWSTTTQNELDRIDPATAKRIIMPIKFGNGQVDCTNYALVAMSAVWVDHCDEREFIKIDPADNHIALRLDYDKIIEQAKAQTISPIGKGGDFLWVILDHKLIRMDPETGAGLSFLPNIGRALTVTDDEVWVTNDDVNHPLLMRMKVANNQIDAAYVINSGVSKIAIGYNSVWVAFEGTSEASGLVQRLDIVP